MTTWVCIASGPSLTKEDCDKVAGMPIITANDSWKMAKGIIYAGDYDWFLKRYAEMPKDREVYTHSAPASRKFHIKRFKGLEGEYNSGQKAIELAIHLKATRVLLLGYDCSVRRGTHWYGDNQKLRNPNHQATLGWQRQFEKILRYHDVPIINCSRETDLLCFPRKTLEEALSLWHPDHQVSPCEM